MNFFKKLFGRDEESGEDLPIELDLEQRRQQLTRLEKSLDALSQGMADHPRLQDNPGWRGRSNEYSRLAGEAMMLNRQGPTRETLLDLAFQVRPVFSQEVPDGLEDLVPLQQDAMAAAEALVAVLPGER